jgi:catechol 2,3-dioxygenase-like lactoylglutathione lyase family enzyme
LPAVQSLDHLVLTVRDLAASIAFYTRALGMQEVTFGAGRKALAFGARRSTCTKPGASSSRRPIAPHPAAPTCAFSPPRRSRHTPRIFTRLASP